MKFSGSTKPTSQLWLKPLTTVAGITAIVLLGTAVSTHAAEQRLLTAVKTATSPTIDGILTDEAWQKAPELGGFVQITPGNNEAKAQTSIRCLYDDQNLYVGISNSQPRGSIVAKAETDGPVWNDDNVDLFLKPHIVSAVLRNRNPEERHYHVILNSAGTKFDEVGTGGPASWDASWEIKTTIQDYGWNAELKIPFATLYEGGQVPAPYTSWGIQIGRTVTSTGENSALFPVLGAFRHEANFGYLVFVSSTAGEAPVRWNLDKQQTIGPRLQNIDRMLTLLKPPSNSDFERKVKGQIEAAGAIKSEFEATAPAQYTTNVRARFLERLDTLEKEIRGSQEQAVSQKARQQGSSVAIAPHPAVKDQVLVRPDFLPPLESIGQAVRATVTPGEYQAASFVFWMPSAQNNITVKLDQLNLAAKGNGKKVALPTNAVDIKWVKCWYQAGNGEVYRGAKVLTPELLLKNPDLVTVDFQKQENILLDYKRPGMYTVPGYPGDATTLQPLKSVPARSATQVWLTVSVPKVLRQAGIMVHTITGEC